MKRSFNIRLVIAFGLAMIAPFSGAAIQGISGDTATDCSPGIDRCFELAATAGPVALGDGNSLIAWSYADASTAGGGQMQYPGPTLFINQGDIVTITLTNTLATEPVSIVFPGQSGVTTSGGDTDGILTRELAPASAISVVYTFTAAQAGTYLYQSGTNPEVQIEMGMVGAIIVRPAGFEPVVDPQVTPANQTAYGTVASVYDREYLFFLTEMDTSAHEAIALGQTVDPIRFNSRLWFINGRNGPDTLHRDFAPWLPSQPYGALAQMEPGERVLMRIISAGRDLHPFHHHGNNAWLIAQDGRVLGNSEVAYPDYLPPAGLNPITDLPTGTMLPNEAVSNYTIQAVPGNTYDAVFTWTGIGMGWDIYGDRPGHTAGDCIAAPAGLMPREDPNSHCSDLDDKVVLPEQQALSFGGLWSGSPFLGSLEVLPPDQGGLNPNGGFSFMWHSHTERELTNDDIFPGGMMTMMIIEAPGTL